MPTYTLSEWGRLRYGDAPGQIPTEIADGIAQVAARSRLAGRDGGGVLEHGRHELRARGVVGIVSAGQSSLEILPKIETGAGQKSENQEAIIRKRLVHMLSMALNLHIDTGAQTQLDWQRHTLLEILISIFCDKLAIALRKGLPRQYVDRDEDLPALRGRLDITRQFTRHAVNPARLACGFDELSEDIALNQIVKVAISHVSCLRERLKNRP